MTPANTRCQAAILAGGMGTRLKVRTGNLPKPMAPILGSPVLAHQIELCRQHGFTRIALLVHYEHEAISSHFGDGSAFGVQLTYCIEQEARGTAGAVRDALPELDDRFLVLYGDTFADVDLSALWQRHLQGVAQKAAVATLLLHPNDHPQDSDLVEVDDTGRVIAVHPYPHPAGNAYANLVNAALYVMEKDGLAAMLPTTGRADLAKHTFPTMLASDRVLQAYVSPEYIKDMGTPARLDKVEGDLIAGVPDRLSSRQQRVAVLLDRDGTLNVEVNHLNHPEQLKLLPRVGEAVRRLNRAGVLAVGVTNQPVIARGELSWDGLKSIHARLDQELGFAGGYLDRIFVCPHHPDSGFTGEVPALKVRCDCRKPETGMIDRAATELNIDRRNSWLVGDTTSDLLAGQRAGLRTVLVRTGHAGLDGKYAVEPDYVMPDLSAAVDWILTGHSAMARQMVALLPEAIKARLVLSGGPARSGKSCSAQVLAELLRGTGSTVHVLGLDGWLKPVQERPEGSGVLERYDMTAACQTLQSVVDSPTRQWLTWPIYERRSRQTMKGPVRSIGPKDILIVEGVTALLTPALLETASVRVQVEVDDVERQTRLQADYAWRGDVDEELAQRLQLREQDELPLVKAGAQHATHHILSHHSA